MNTKDPSAHSPAAPRVEGVDAFWQQIQSSRLSGNPNGANDYTTLNARSWHAATGMLDQIKTDISQIVGGRIREARVHIKRAQLATLLGVHENTLGKMERGESLPDAMQLMQLSALTGKSVMWLLGGTTEDQPSLPMPPEVPPGLVAVELGHMIYVPLFDLRASAGNGAFNDEEKVVHMRAFALDYIRRELHILHNEIALVNVVGNSMEPDIHSGDVVLVDRKDKDISVEGPHLVRVDGSLLVKMVQRRPGGILRVSSKNETYEPFEVSMNGDLEDFEVLGRVRWAGVTFR